MKHLLHTLLIVMVALPTQVRAEDTRIFLGDEPYRVEEFSVGNSGSLTVRTSGGNILVVGGQSGKARVEVHVTKNGRTLTVEDTDLSHYRLTIEKRGNEIFAEARRISSRNNIWNGYGNESISFTVYIPTDYSSDLATSGGRIQVSGLNGAQKIRTSGGSLNLENLSGDIDATTSGGSITLTDITGNLDARTSGGSIRAGQLAGDIRLITSGGSIRLEDVKGSITAQTSGGSITANVSEIENHLRLETSGGSVTATLPAGQGFDLDARGSRVVNETDFFSGRSERGRVEGTVNGGGAPVHLRTSSGTVTIRYN